MCMTMTDVAVSAGDMVQHKCDGRLVDIGRAFMDAKAGEPVMVVLSPAISPYGNGD